MKIYVSHGAGNVDDTVHWFVVEPQTGVRESMAGTPITLEQALESLRSVGRTVVELDVEPWANRPPMTTERWGSILHKTHGWLEAPDGCHFQASTTGKTIELHEPGGDGTQPHHYPYGTTWRTASILAYADPKGER